MPLDALGLALAAAVLHALWNLLLAGARDREGTAGAALVCAVVLFAPVAAVTWRVEPAAWPFIAVSAALEVVYVVVLITAYGRADLSVVYPVSRGLAPVLVLIASVAFLGFGSSAGEVVGVGLVGCGIVLVQGGGDGSGGRSRSGLLLAVLLGGLIATYTLVDRYGVRHANPLSYVELILIGPAIAYPLLVGPRRARASLGRRSVVAGASMLGAYGLTLAALRLASAASVAAVRESSVVIAVVLAAPVLHESVGPRRVAGALLVVTGIALIAVF
jgi:drug/metabolite transporter (DMT)-like permease